MDPWEREYEGIAGVRAAGELLLARRSEDLAAGLWEAADMEWRWATGKTDTFHTTLWAGTDGGDVAFLSVVQSTRNAARDGVYEAACAWLPSAEPAVRAKVVPAMVARLTALSASAASPVAIIADERDPDLCIRLEEAGFRRDPAQDMTQMWRPRGACGTAPLPPGFWFDDERTGATGESHPLVKRNGPHVAERLHDCSVYRPDLDPRIRVEDEAVVA